MYPPLLDPDEEPAVVVVPDVVVDDEEVLEEDMMIETRSSLLAIEGPGVWIWSRGYCELEAQV